MPVTNSRGREESALPTSLYHRLLAGTALGVAVSTAVFWPVAAQEMDTKPDSEATAEAADGASEADSVELPTISVQGRPGTEGYKANVVPSVKYTAPLIDTPKSVTVIPEEVLRDSGATSLTEALRTVPGITMAMGEGGQPFSDRPFIRGYESTSGLLVDGVRDTGSQQRGVFNLEQVVVAKGPTGAYAGRGAPGGSVNLVTKSARDYNFVAGSATVGTADHKRFTGDVNQVITDSVALRLNVMVQDADVPGRDAVFDDRFGFAPTISFGIGEPTTVTASYYHYDTDGLADYGHPYDPSTGRPVDVDRDNFYGLVNRDFEDTRVDSGTIEVEHDFSMFTLRNITRFTRSENDYIATNPDDSQGNVPNGLVFRNPKSRRSQNETLINQTDVSANFDAFEMRHSLAAGLEFGRERTTQASYAVDTSAPGGVAIPRGGCNLFGAGAASGFNCTDLFNPDPNDPWTGSISLRTPTRTRVDTAAAYVFDSIDVTDRWILNLGLRFDDFSTETSTGLSNDSSFLTYQAGVVYKITPTGSVYVSYGTSASPSGVTAGDGGENIATSNQDLEPEEAINYEVGTKWELFQRRLSVNAAVFRTEIQNGHVSAAPGRGAPQVAVGEQRVDGFEFSVAGSVTPQWQVFGGYSFLKSEIVDAGPVNFAQNGNELPNTPKHSFSLWTTYEVIPDFTVGGGAYYMSKVYGNTANTVAVPNYWRFDAMASYEVTESVNLRLNVQNLTDEVYYDRAYVTHMATVAPGRQVLLTCNVNF